MENLIEPNIHPILVHFAYALAMTSAFSLIVSSFFAKDGWRDTLRHAGDWMLFFAALAIVATVAAGFQAYYSVAHDGPSHAAMTTHRNWAVPSAGAVLALAVWRYMKRAGKPGPLFALLLLVAAGFLTVTAWWGGRLVYGYGLGVKSMPTVEGEGHDHEHGPGEGHGDEGDGVDASPDHSHEDEPAVEPTAASGTDTAAASGEYPSIPSAVVDAFGAALKNGDAAIVERLLAPEVLIAEGGGAERSFAEYAGHHMPADMAFTKAVEFTLKERKLIEGHDLTTVISSSQVHGEFQGKTVHSMSMETMVLKLVEGQWRIAHIHWSSAPIAGEHEH